MEQIICYKPEVCQCAETDQYSWSDTHECLQELWVCSHCNIVQLVRLSQRIQFSSINSRTRFVLCVACHGSFEIDIRKELGALIQTIQYWYSGFWASSQLVVCSLDMPMRSHIQFYFFFFFFFAGERDVGMSWSILIKSVQLVSNSILSIEVRSKLLAPLKL